MKLAYSNPQEGLCFSTAPGHTHTRFTVLRVVLTKFWCACYVAEGSLVSRFPVSTLSYHLLDARSFLLTI